MSNEDYVDETNNVDGFHGNLENPLRNGDELLDDDIFMDANLANAEVGASEPNEGAHFDQLDESYKIDGWEDIGKTEFLNIVDVDIKRYHFSDLGVAFDFYNAFAKSRGFSGRKSKTRKHNGIINRQNFVCCREGFRQKKPDNMHTRKQEPRAETRCGCKAKVQVSFDAVSGRWIVSKFSDLHNHDLLPPIFTAMLPGHRKIPAADIEQINIMRKGGLGTAHIFAALSSQSGGHHNVPFLPRDLYNQVAQQRRRLKGDASAALQFLRKMKSIDPVMVIRYEVDRFHSIKNLFWCDGISQMDYQLFGDVLAFDATYKKNKYHCPLVIFSGVNNHNRTVVFAAALVCDESEQTYIWLLKSLLEAMKGKAPISVITDGALSMKNAIEKVFPNAHHRLCAWHLIRNATSNVGNPRFTSQFKKCMLGDYEVGVFRSKWDRMVEEFDVQDKQWIIDMYDNRHSWATAHIRGKFFAGFRTTSRCEGLHSVIAKYVKSRYNLRDFVEHFDRCVAYIRFKDSLADFECAHGVPVMQTHLLSLEKSAANLYTREVFFLFRPIIIRSGSMKVLDCIDVGSYMLYTVVKYGSPNDTWQVSFCDLPMEFTCSCMRMESFGIPCEHILSVLVTLDICELPKCLVLDRWTKNVKQQIQDTRGFTWDCLKSTQYWCLMDWFRLVATLSAGKDDRFRSMRDWAINTVDKMKADDIASAVASSSAIPATHTDPRDPPIRRRAKDRAGQRCSICRELGHNKTTCPDRSKYDRDSHERHSLPTDDDAYEAMWDEEEDFIYEEDEGECAVNSSSESSRDQDMEIDDSNYEFGNEDDGVNEIN
ncbi:protein FAR1-RELATED SEQUENCE 5-like [Arachis hypogaea]|uniref:protein FAR1-RELATED SEQUENCE 5-like n=1 Tax=Arachis hypogaea TaxID=3818 RepID=UPI000DED3409|nr:protein FAR1-RELATED SEQUENCE 5-like [Arachis hypogaea]